MVQPRQLNPIVHPMMLMNQNTLVKANYDKGGPLGLPF
jgi:hypothetical protein